MDLIKIKTKLFNLTRLFLLLNFILEIECLLEFPIKIKPITTPRYKGVHFDTKNPPHIENVLNKYNNNSSNSNNIKIFTESGDIKFISAYLLSIKIELGTSNQEFNLVLDTGSTITWVPLMDSIDSFFIEHHYDPSLSKKSKKLKEDFEIIYGSGSCNGNYYKDIIKYINDKSFDFVFGGAVATDFSVEGVDGIIGLSRKYSDNSKSFIHMLCESGITKSKIFSFKLGLNISTENGGKFYIGKHKDFDKDNVVTCEMTNSNYFEKNLWACEMTSFSILGFNKTIKLTAEKKVSVIFDSGTNAIFLPLYYLQHMAKALEKINCSTNKESGNRYQLICFGKIPDFHLVIGGHTFILPGEYFFYYNKNVASSKILFQNSIEHDSEIYIIGSPFFMLFHILFDSYSNELHFYPEKDEFLIKGSWWNTKHILIVVIFAIFVIILIILIILLMLWKKKNKIDMHNKEHYQIKSYLGLLQK